MDLQLAAERAAQAQDVLKVLAWTLEKAGRHTEAARVHARLKDGG